ncbi:hypothetical protein NBRC116583_13350 [Arenicella sp. 4NH20-0111]|uniref:hypothetical protein n=1 Tax=Arenicella sp. 4NH20-0111 TaxID=3127648 RepID=UPI0031093F14
MKLSETVIELMFELSNLEGEKHSGFLHGEGSILRNNLLKLFEVTDNPESQEIIIDIMSEAGYPWFNKLAKPKRDLAKQNSMESTVETPRIMSDDDFMSLLPANGQLH